MTVDSHFLYSLPGNSLGKKNLKKGGERSILVFRSSLCRSTHVCWKKKCILVGLRPLLILSISFGVLSLKVSSAVLL